MRVTGGILCGRRIGVPVRDVRPTQDRVREAMFASLGGRVEDARVLDLFAGSGAVGLEAWIRGAASVCWVEFSRKVFQQLKSNVEDLCTPDGGGVECVCADAWRFLAASASRTGFDIIFADPPYDRTGENRQLEKTLRALGRGPMLAADGLLVYEQSVREPVGQHAGWAILRDRAYGQTRILMIQRRALQEVT